MSSTVEKVVYVLGAGFSKPAGAPNQAEILKAIFHLDRPHDDRFQNAVAALRDFLENDLGLGPYEIEGVPLEDIYTPIDRCIADRTSLRSRSTAELVYFREELGYLISIAIAEKITAGLGAAGAQYIRDFAAYLVGKAQYRAVLAQGDSAKLAKEYDPFSVISLNWDILLDNALHDALFEHDQRSNDYDPFGVVDYCCYVSSLHGGDSRIRSGLWSLGCRGFNVKLLKLHGSMNWLQCPNCQRLFVGFGDKANLLAEVGQTLCRHCDLRGHKNKLAGSLIMPTFLKDLTNFQIKLVWQNAGVELMEADKVVFIGYSLPHADFEFRQLLSRMIGKSVPIEVVLFHDGTSSSEQAFKDEVKRYEQFFGSARTTCSPGGVIEYVGRLTNVGDPL